MSPNHFLALFNINLVGNVSKFDTEQSFKVCHVIGEIEAPVRLCDLGSSFKGDKHIKSNFQAQLRHNHRYLCCNLEKYKFKS